MRVLLAVALLVSLGLAGCGGNDKDTDRDGLTDRFERGGWLVRIDYLRERVEYRTHSDVSGDDSDGDGLTDSEEFLLGIDPAKADTDQDGLTDCQEERHTNRTECEAPPEGVDADGGYGTDPKRADSDPGSGRFVRRDGWFTDHTDTLANGPETGDGLSDGEEVLGYLVAVPGGERRVQTNPRDADEDDDGLGDGEEREYLGDPTVPDTDGDGCEDGGDLFPERNENLHPGLLEFTLRVGHARANVRFNIDVGGSNLLVPPGGTLPVEGGQTLDLRPYQDVGTKPGTCTFPAFAPNVPLTVVVEDVSATGSRQLDTWSTTPGDTPEVSWDVRSASLSWTDGSAAPQPALLSGQDGVLRLQPRVS